MQRKYPPYVTIDEALGLLLRLDGMLIKYGTLEILLELIKEAERKYEQADGDFERQIAGSYIDTCVYRYELAVFLQEHLEKEMASPKSQFKLLTPNTTTEPEIELVSLSSWAADYYGIDIPCRPKPKAVKEVIWDHVTIKIYRDFKIRCFIGDKEKKFCSFQEIDLMGKRKYEPNYQGIILIGLSLGKKFPPKMGKPTAAQKKAMTLLRAALKKLIGLSNDPFYPFNNADGWVPRFTLTNHQKCGAERAQQQAKHIDIDDPDNQNIIYEHLISKSTSEDLEGNGFAHESDLAGEWLRENNKRYR